ncbi:ComEA family DNA-binding protein [Psychroserpens sp. BH13MA-6]
MFSKQQRSGIFLLLLLILIFQCAYFFIDFSSEAYNVDAQELAKFETEIEALRLAKLADSKPKVFPFNPNFITDYKGYTLGMSNAEIDRLLAFRAKGKWINSAQDFQEVTKISDSLLQTIAPLFKFPEWVTNPKPKTYTNQKFSPSNTPKTFEQKQDLNTASESQLKRIYGIGEKLSERIVNYRTKTGGFVADIQLKEVYGLSDEVIENVLKEFTVKTGTPITKININTATIEELVQVKYIDYEIAYNILEARTLRDGFKSLDDLLKVKDFPIKKSDIIKLYLTLD